LRFPISGWLGRRTNTGHSPVERFVRLTSTPKAIGAVLRTRQASNHQPSTFSLHPPQ
jgi:hypothetical protein